MILPFLLHAANRNIKLYSEDVMNAFYRIKDQVLKKYGKVVGYDVQKIDGKVCNSCGGKGQHPKYSNRPPYNIYDWADCYHCFGGWYRFPKWIALHRIAFGGYIFHKPLKREECVKNPFTKDELGWQVTEQPIIKGYIEHEKHPFGKVAVLILFLFYNYPMFKYFFVSEWKWKTQRFRNWVAEKKRLSGWIFEKPKVYVREYYDENFQHSENDLPF